MKYTVAYYLKKAPSVKGLSAFKDMTKDEAGKQADILNHLHPTIKHYVVAVVPKLPPGSAPDPDAAPTKQLPTPDRP